MLRRHLFLSLAIGSALFVFAGPILSAPVVEDPFDEDPIDAGGEWELYNPALATFQHGLEAGWWRFVFPTGVVLNHWTTVDDAIQLRRADMPENFILETRVRFLGSGDPDAPIWPPTTESYHAALMVCFGPLDVFYWGYYTNATLRLERSGVNNLCQITPDLQEVSLQIKKIGSLYSFSWRADDGDDWTLACTQTVAAVVPTQVGLIFKTWVALTQEETFEFDYFTILEPPETAPVIGEVSPDPMPAFADTPFQLQMELLDGFPVPEWSLLQGPAGAFIDDVTGLIDWTPAPADVGATFAFQVQAQNTSGTDTEEFDVLVNPIDIDDPFDEDPADAGGSWELYDPVNANAEHWIEDGWWRFIVPTGINLDHWSTVDRGIQLRRAGMPEDFVVETRIHFVGSGDPDNPIWPPVVENYQAALMVYFAPRDVFYWGPYRGTTLMLERSGINSVCQFNPGLQEVSLQIRKEGSAYSFSWRETDDDNWSLVCTQTVDPVVTPPRMVGIIFKTWAALSQQQTFDFDYLRVKAPEPDPAWIEPLCDFGDPDIAWIDMPYIRPLDMGGQPFPDFSVASGPPLSYDPGTKLLAGWTPDVEETIPLALEATNAANTATAEWTVQVSSPSLDHDDEFDEDPGLDDSFWDLYEPELGVEYSLVDEDGTSWWRMDIPSLGDSGLTFDHWSTVDRGVQLRHMIGDGGEVDDFLIETRMRVDPATVPPADDEFHVGLMLYFGQFDILYFGAMEERTIGGIVCNVSVERSGYQNILGGYAPGLLQGSTIGLRIEKKCQWYSFFFRDESEGATWQYAGTYQTLSNPIYVGLVMKTWGDGLAHNSIFDFDYFDIVESGGPPEPVFLRGDVDGNGLITIGDPINLLNHMFADTAEPKCPDAGDIDDDGHYTIGDAVALLNFQFASGTPPKDPGPTACGPDPTPDGFNPCEFDRAKCP
ncbi:MAG: hypothetical protein JXP34_18100 [Planctomycetes bacterium]|nr:hypothetical protein [Planctomycetota bacterium]